MQPILPAEPNCKYKVEFFTSSGVSIEFCYVIWTPIKTRLNQKWLVILITWYWKYFVYWREVSVVKTSSKKLHNLNSLRIWKYLWSWGENRYFNQYCRRILRPSPIWRGHGRIELLSICRTLLCQHQESDFPLTTQCIFRMINDTSEIPISNKNPPIESNWALYQGN